MAHGLWHIAQGTLILIIYNQINILVINDKRK